MLRQFVKAVVVLSSLITSVASVNAQSTQRFKVDVPFQFFLNGQTLSAGTYTIERTNPAKPHVLTLKRHDGSVVRVIITQRVERDTPSAESSLLFIRREGKHYLYQVWNLGALNGREIPPLSERERSDRQRKDLTLVTLKSKRN